MMTIEIPLPLLGGTTNTNLQKIGNTYGLTGAVFRRAVNEYINIRKGSVDATCHVLSKNT